MEDLPHELIGHILSRVGSARDVIRASATSQKWHEAFQKHLHTLSFNSRDWQGYRRLSISYLQTKITEAITQTSSLECLLLLMDDIGYFLPSAVLCWIDHTKGSLRELYYDINTKPSVNVLKFVGHQKLEVLELSHHLVTEIQPSFVIFPCLRSLVLRDVTILKRDLCFLIKSCPTLESLKLIGIEIVKSDVRSPDTIKLTAPSLKRMYIEDICCNKVVLEVDKIDFLYLKETSVHVFNVIGKGTLRHLIIEDVMPLHLDIVGSDENLETVDISNFTISWPKLYKMISKAAKVRKLRLWQVLFLNDIFDLELIAASFPLLTHLSLCYYLRDGVRPYGQQGPRSFENVVFLKVGWNALTELFADWVEEMIILCPSLKVLVISGLMSEMNCHGGFQKLGRFTTSIVHVMRRYSNVDVRFEYEDDCS